MLKNGSDGADQHTEASIMALAYAVAASHDAIRHLLSKITRLNKQHNHSERIILQLAMSKRSLLMLSKLLL